MKPTIFAVLLLCVGLLSSCQGVSSTSSSSPAPEESVRPTLSSSRPEKEYRWGAEIDPLLEEALEDSFDLVPVFPDSSFEGKNKRNGKQLYTVLRCYGADSGKNVETYKAVLRLREFLVQDGEEENSFSAVKQTEDVAEVVLQASVKKDEVGDPYVELLLARVENRTREWPSEKIEASLGQDLPSFPAKAYSFSIDENNIMTLLGYGIPDIEMTLSDYLATLKEKGFLSLGSLEEGGTMFTSGDKSITLALDEIDETTLRLRAVKSQA